MVKLVADNGVAFAEDGFEEAAIGVEARGIQNGVFRFQKITDFFLERLVQILRAAYEADGSEAKPVFIERFMRCLDERRVIGEAEVIIGAQIDHLAPVGETHERALRAGDEPFALQQAGGFERQRLALEPFTKVLEQCRPFQFSRLSQYRYYNPLPRAGY